MERHNIERLIAMLQPGAGEEDVEFVIDEIMRSMSKDQSVSKPRTDQQKVDLYDSTIANDPRYW